MATSLLIHMSFMLHYDTDASGSGGFGYVQATSRWSQ
jgi:hypothetical protein